VQPATVRVLYCLEFVPVKTDYGFLYASDAVSKQKTNSNTSTAARGTENDINLILFNLCLEQLYL
jgi:hypothetical protein